MIKVLTPKEVAETLRISISHVYELARTGDLKKLNLPGKLVRFDAHYVYTLTTTHADKSASSLKTEKAKGAGHKANRERKVIWRA